MTLYVYIYVYYGVDKNQEYDSYSFKSLSKKINKKYKKDKSDDYEL